MKEATKPCGCLWPAATLPAREMRTMTMDLPTGTVLPDDFPDARGQNVSFFVELLGAWVAMGFRSPKIAVNRELQA